MLSKRGQNSFEILVITVIVFAIVIEASAAYFSIHNSTTALELFKLTAVEKLNRLDKEYFINRIDFKEYEDRQIVLCLYTNPHSRQLFQSQEVTEWQNSLINKTGYEKVAIEINPASCSRTQH